MEATRLTRYGFLGALGTLGAFLLAKAQALLAQQPGTRITPDQIQVMAADAAPPPTLKVYGVTGGRFVTARIGANLTVTVDSTVNPAELVISAPAPVVPPSLVPPVYSVAAIRQADNSWLTAPAASRNGTLLVHRNGIRQKEGPLPGDYTRDAANPLRIIPTTGWDAGDGVLFDFPSPA
jgi:hypothetical protein